MATAAQAELGISAVTTDALYADPFYMPDKIVENNLTEKKTPCIFKPFEGSGTSSSSPYQWEVPPDPSLWIDAEIVVKGRMRIAAKDKTTGKARDWTNTEKTGTIDGENGKYGVIDDIAQTMWSRISLIDNGIPVEDPNPKPYPFRYKFESILNFDKPKKEKVFKYSQNHMRDDRSGANTGLINKQNRARFQQLCNTWTDFEIVLHTDFLSMDNLIPTNNNLNIILERMNDEFCFMIDKTWMAQQTLAGTPPPTPTVDLKYMEMRLQKSKSKTERRKAGLPPVTIGRMRDKNIAPNNTNFNFAGVFRGEDLPQQVLVTILPQKAWNGDLGEDPFRWKKPKVVEAFLLIDGVHYEPLEKLTNQKYGEDGHGDLNMYLTSMRAAGYQYLARDGTLDISMDQWSNDTWFLGFDRSPGKNNSLSTIFQPKPGQHMDLVMHLKEPLDTTHVILVYGIYKTYLEFATDGRLNKVPHIIC